MLELWQLRLDASRGSRIGKMNWKLNLPKLETRWLLFLSMTWSNCRAARRLPGVVDQLFESRCAELGADCWTGDPLDSLIMECWLKHWRWSTRWLEAQHTEYALMALDKNDFYTDTRSTRRMALRRDVELESTRILSRRLLHRSWWMLKMQWRLKTDAPLESTRKTVPEALDRCWRDDGEWRLQNENYSLEKTPPRRGNFPLDRRHQSSREERAFFHSNL